MEKSMKASSDNDLYKPLSDPSNSSESSESSNPPQWGLNNGNSWRGSDQNRKEPQHTWQGGRGPPSDPTNSSDSKAELRHRSWSLGRIEGGICQGAPPEVETADNNIPPREEKVARDTWPGAEQPRETHWELGRTMGLENRWLTHCIL